MSTAISRSSSSSTFGDEFFVDTEKGSLLARNESSLNVESRKSNERPRAESSEMRQSKNDSRQATSIDSTAADRAAKKGGKVVFAASLYSFCSVSMVLTNKSLSSSYNHLLDGDLNVLLVVFQAVIAVVLVETCKVLKWVEYPSFDLKVAKIWAPVNILFCAMLFTSMASLQHNTVPMVTIFKNVTNIMTCMGDYYLFNTPVGFLVILAFGVMLGGACLAAINDVKVTGLGVYWMAANCVSTAGYVLYMKFAMKRVKLSKFGMVFYNNILCTFFLFPASVFLGQFSLFVNSPALHNYDYFSKNIFAGFIGFFLNFASLNCVSQTGPTTYAIIGSLNKIPTSLIGWFIFDTVITSQTWFFICVSMTGGFIYSYAKIKESGKSVRKSSVAGS
mmetsp:Transcript_1300/g.1340  ORF Transcript_1300/g.1340 Transcript_1300/m.1340 type:complete len:390 (+) Transcript_1300:37-1206(+)